MAAENKEARYWEALSEGKVRCLLCPQLCRIASGESGFCRVRRNAQGRLIAGSYAQVTSICLDPIEKKPLFHFHPGSRILSVGALGCNLACRFCQNWEISQGEAPTRCLTPEQAVELAAHQPDNIGIAFTYNEPLIWFEYVMDTARLIRQAGMRSVLVTNGEINQPPLEELLGVVDAINVDVKGGPEFYRRLCRGKLDPVRRTVELAHRAGVWVEVTNLVIPGHNDSEEDIAGLVDWLVGVGREIPLHFSRYHPSYLMKEPATPLETLRRCREVAQKKLDYVYLGNMFGEGEHTYCPNCKRLVIQRSGFEAKVVGLEGCRCVACGTRLAGE